MWNFYHIIEIKLKKLYNVIKKEGVMMSDTRIPSQKRSIEKRNRIIKMGFELMCEEGYYQTTTTDIAKYAGVSTGIIYQYFNDKKEIFI